MEIFESLVLKRKRIQESSRLFDNKIKNLVSKIDLYFKEVDYKITTVENIFPCIELKEEEFNELKDLFNVKINQDFMKIQYINGLVFYIIKYGKF